MGKYFLFEIFPSFADSFVMFILCPEEICHSRSWNVIWIYYSSKFAWWYVIQKKVYNKGKPFHATSLKQLPLSRALMSVTFDLQCHLFCLNFIPSPSFPSLCELGGFCVALRQHVNTCTLYRSAEKSMVRAKTLWTTIPLTKHTATLYTNFIFS